MRIWLVGCFGLNGPLRQYSSLGCPPEIGMKKKRNMIDERINVQRNPPTPTASTVDPCPTLIQISRTPRHWKFTQHHRTTDHPVMRIETKLNDQMIKLIKIILCHPLTLSLLQTVLKTFAADDFKDIVGNGETAYRNVLKYWDT